MNEYEKVQAALEEANSVISKIPENQIPNEIHISRHIIQNLMGEHQFVVEGMEGSTVEAIATELRYLILQLIINNRVQEILNKDPQFTSGIAMEECLNSFFNCDDSGKQSTNPELNALDRFLASFHS